MEDSKCCVSVGIKSASIASGPMNIGQGIVLLRKLNGRGKVSWLVMVECAAHSPASVLRFFIT